MILKSMVEIKSEIFEEISINIKEEYYDELNGLGLINDGYLSNKIFSNDKKVLDVIRFVYKIDKIKENDFNETRSVYNDIYPKNIDESIVLLLESPHKDEYEKIKEFDLEKFIPKGPAQGATGRSIRKFKDFEYLDESKLKHKTLLQLISENNINKELPIILVNPVQYQASLGSFLKGKLKADLRDEIWIKLYKVLEKDFIERIKSYNPILIINGCTDNLKQYVNDSLKNYNIINTQHPYAWTFGGIKIK